MLARFTSAAHAWPWENLRFTGDRVLLRPLSVRDDLDMYLYASDPEVTRFLPWEPAPSPDSVRPFLEEQVARRRRGESMAFAIVFTETGRMVGSTDIMDMRMKRGQAELGYLIARPYWGRGLMTEAARLTLCCAFDTLGIERITAWADEENVASQRVMQKLGMTLSGNENRWVKGERRPYVQYALDRATWEATAAAAPP